MKTTLLPLITNCMSAFFSEDIIITGQQQVFGGDINTTYILFTNRGNYFLKSNSKAAAGFFEKEYNGLQLLRNKSLLTVPEPLLYGSVEKDSFFITEYLQKEAITGITWDLLGKGLAELHQHSQPAFGLHEDNFIGSLPQRNKPCDNWAEFYAAQRILPFVRQAFDHQKLSAADAKAAEQICERLGDIFPKEPPALLHGDLWNGNFMACCEGKPAVYDPAVYYGSREMDIAMTILFGGFHPEFYRQYEASYPLHAGWRQRVSLCQLYPLLMHLILFGGSYYNQVKRVLDEYQ